AFGNDDAVGAFVYCREPEQRTSHYRARMFAPAAGVPEDPATGSAAAAFAGVVVEFDKPTGGWHSRVIEQGFEMGRPSLITLSLEMEGGRLETARIGGRAVPVMSGQLEV
ncbi:MAG: PhzF family phenazine biosynthesis protein, partial [Pseudomonadota bacterium]